MRLFETILVILLFILMPISLITIASFPLQSIALSLFIFVCWRVFINGSAI